MKQFQILEELENYTPDTGENFSDLLEAEGEQQQLEEGEVIGAKITAIDGDFVILDAGLKSEARVPLREFMRDGDNDIQIGDDVKVYLERTENRYGDVVLSREKAVREEAWSRLEQQHESDEHVDGVILGRIKGGFTVELGGAIAFLPGSQVDVRPVKDVSPLINISQPFKILKMDKKRGNIVVSRRAILEESREEARKEILDQIKEGQVLEGIVKNITDYGAFIDLGGVDGLLHVTDVSWKRISHPSELLSIGQTVEVMVTKFNEDNKRISLGMKQLEENPWQKAAEKYQIGSKAKGRVSNITDYGAFIELEPGIEGLVHVSEMSWTRKNISPNQLVSAGDEVEVMVLEIEPEKYRISLGIKQCSENPWEEFSSSRHQGDVFTAEIKNITDFGLFIDIGGEVEGLVHSSDLIWSGDAEEELKKYSKGDQVEVKVLAIDVEKERVSLGIKQLTEAPADLEEREETKKASIRKGEVVTCTVIEQLSDGIKVAINDSVNAIIKKLDLARERSEQRVERFAIGDRIDAKVISADNAKESYLLSIKALEIEEHKKAIAEYGSTDSGASLGDILGQALTQSTQQAEKAKEEK